MAPDDPYYLQNVHHRYWMTFISCAIQKSNATIILDRAKAINININGDAAIFIPREAEYNVKNYMDQRMDNSCLLERRLYYYPKILLLVM